MGASPSFGQVRGPRMPRVFFEGLERCIEVEFGTTLLEAAERAGVALHPDCRFGWCGSDPVVLVEGEGHVSPQDEDEAENIAFNHFPESVRMACVTKVYGDVRIRLFNL